MEIPWSFCGAMNLHHCVYLVPAIMFVWMRLNTSIHKTFDELYEAMNRHHWVYSPMAILVILPRIKIQHMMEFLRSN